MPNSEAIEECVSRINNIWESADSIDEFIKNLKDNERGCIPCHLGNYKCGSFYIFPLLSKEEEERLSEIKNQIDQESQNLERYKEKSNAKGLKKCAKYVEMYSCLKHVQCNESYVDCELTTLQRFVNLLLSLFHMLSYRFYKEFEVKIDSVVDFKDGKNDVFAKFNKIDLDRYRLSDKQIERRVKDISDDRY